MKDFPHSDSVAAHMLADGLRKAAAEDGLSLREIGRRLGYSQAVVLSHMASGRVPIPLDRATDIAREVGLPARPFLESVLRQRHPRVDWSMLTTPGDALTDELESLAGKPLSSLSPDHQRVLREAVRDPDPDSRWLTIPELAVVNLLRAEFPALRAEGLTSEQRNDLRAGLQLVDSDGQDKKPK